MAETLSCNQETIRKRDGSVTAHKSYYHEYEMSNRFHEKAFARKAIAANTFVRELYVFAEVVQTLAIGSFLMLE